MKIIFNNIIPFKGFAAINLFGVIFVRKDVHLTVGIIQHERIHTAQMKELGYILFYLLYFIEWLVKLLRYGLESYYNISFEREAYEEESSPFYLANRKKYSFLKYV
ncbi:hypothetical protein [Viscerimonas tarda]